METDKIFPLTILSWLTFFLKCHLSVSKFVIVSQVGIFFISSQHKNEVHIFPPLAVLPEQIG